MYTNIIKHSFKAGHQIRIDEDLFEGEHIHDWSVDLHISANELNENGCVVDFKELDHMLHQITNEWTQSGLGCMSTEQVAQRIYSELKSCLKERHPRAAVDKVVVWEDERHGAEYFL